MKTSARVAPPNSVVLVKDTTQAQIPDTMGGRLFASTDSCVAIGCRSEIDGETQLTLGPLAEVRRGNPPVFQKKLLTPARRVTVQLITGEIILEQSVPSTETDVQIWVNDTEEPDEIVVGVR